MDSTPLLTSQDLSDPKISKAVAKLGQLDAFSRPFDDLKEALKDFMIAKSKKEPSWENYWNLEQAIMTYLFGEGHA
jgi:hypothetical protein